MDNNLFNRYAYALLDLAKENDEVEETRNEIKELVKIFKLNNDFIYLVSTIIDDQNEVSMMIDKIFNSSSELIKNFIKVIIRRNRGKYLYQIFKETLFRFDDYLNIEEGIIYSSSPIEEKKILEINLALSNLLNKKIELSNVIDSSLIGGFKIILKNEIYDASILEKIEQLKKQLIGG